MYRLTLAFAASLALTAGACATTPDRGSGQAASAAKQPSAEAPAATAAKDDGGQSEGKKKLPWWRLSQYSRAPEEKPWIYGDIRPGPGPLSGEDGGFVLYREGEPGRSADPSKPTKVRR